MRLQFGKDSNTGGYSGLAVGKSGRDGIQPGAYRGGPRDHLRIVVIRLRRAAEFAKRADRSTVHLVGLGFRKGCWGSEVLAGWPDGVRCTLGWRQWPHDRLLPPSLWFRCATLCRRSTRGQSDPCSAGNLLCLQGHETNFRAGQLAGNGGQHYHHGGLRDSDHCSASIAEQRLRRLLRISEARAPVVVAAVVWRVIPQRNRGNANFRELR